MYKSLGFLFICFIMFSPAKAEVSVSAGARAGFNFAHLRKYTAPDMYKKKEVFGSDLAAILQIDFNKYISLQTEVEFSQKGQRWIRSQDSAKYNNKLVINYIQFPILAVGRFGTDKVKGIVQLGPYVSYWTGGFTQSSVSVDKQSKNAETTRYDFSTIDMRVDVGLIVGAGTDIKVGKGWIEIAARYNAGFLSVTKKNSGLPKLYNSNFGLSVGYLYTIK